MLAEPHWVEHMSYGHIAWLPLLLFEADAAQGIGGVDHLMTSESNSKDLIDEVG